MTGNGSRLWAGVDIGGSKTLALACDEAGTVLGRWHTGTPAVDGGAAMLDTAATAVTRAVARAGGSPGDLVGVGVGAAGVIDPDLGTVLAASASFPGWRGTKITPELSARLDGVPVASDNDVNTMLLGEARVGGDGVRHAMAVTLGTGVGGALLVDGALLHGGGAGAGEIGHTGRFGDEPCTCGGVGHVEAYASGHSLSRRFRRMTGRSVAGEEVAAAAAGGDDSALLVFEDAGRCLGESVADACGLLGIDLVILGGSVTASWSLLAPSMLRALGSRPLLTGHPPDVRLTSLGADGAALGAVELALSRLT